MTTKPYVSGAAYLNRMSDYCDNGAFNPKTNCPITHLYWAFLARHQMKLRTNPRLTLALKNLKKRGEEKIQEDKRVFVFVQKVLGNKGQLTPEHLPGVH